MLNQKPGFEAIIGLQIEMPFKVVDGWQLPWRELAMMTSSLHVRVTMARIWTKAEAQTQRADRMRVVGTASNRPSYPRYHPHVMDCICTKTPCSNHWRFPRITVPMASKLWIEAPNGAHACAL
ncbi:hypothetical protein TgHK011_007808 [Trichoderma gracile]|nr:hypothetical protein TgHK011_007808 [Trichoderma gracile]